MSEEPLARILDRLLTLRKRLLRTLANDAQTAYTGGPTRSTPMGHTSSTTPPSDGA